MPELTVRENPDAGDNFGHSRISPDIYVAVIVMDEGKVLIGRAPDGVDKGKITVPMSPIKAFESFSDAARRTVSMYCGTVDVNPQSIIFVCESIYQNKDDHRVVLFVFADITGEKRKGVNSCWVDVRELGDYQDEMSELARDGFYKLSIVLQRKAAVADLKVK